TRGHRRHGRRQPARCALRKSGGRRAVRRCARWPRVRRPPYRQSDGELPRHARGRAGLCGARCGYRSRGAMSPHISSAPPADRPRLLAIQSASLASTWPELLETAITGPGRVLVSGQTAVGYALAVGSDPTHLAELAVAP